MVLRYLFVQWDELVSGVRRGRGGRASDIGTNEEWVVDARLARCVSLCIVW